MEWLVAAVKSTEPAKGYVDVMVAGDPEWQTEAKRRSEGIPLGDGTWEALVKTAERLGVTVPA
jgi:LDH2 family malate/lactate/ureidoglycolate dehydrogenase